MCYVLRCYHLEVISIWTKHLFSKFFNQKVYQKEICSHWQIWVEAEKFETGNEMIGWAVAKTKSIGKCFRRLAYLQLCYSGSGIAKEYRSCLLNLLLLKYIVPQEISACTYLLCAHTTTWQNERSRVKSKESMSYFNAFVFAVRNETSFWLHTRKSKRKILNSIIFALTNIEQIPNPHSHSFIKYDESLCFGCNLLKNT